jgi:hypothetical protein
VLFRSDEWEIKVGYSIFKKVSDCIGESAYLIIGNCPFTKFCRVGFCTT